MSDEQKYPKNAEETREFITRRGFVTSAAVATTAVAASTLLDEREAEAAAAGGTPLAAKPPAGFVPFSAPGRIVRVNKSGSLQPNGLYPKPADAESMLTKALTELTGTATLADALKKFVSPQDTVAVKLNGIAKMKKFGTNKEFVLPLLNGLLAAGIPASNIVVFEQYGSFLAGTRVEQSNVPSGIRTAVHKNKDMATGGIKIHSGKRPISTKFARPLMEATAVINVSLIKDHSICGYTGCLKNMTHGCIDVPHHHHEHNASPQIANIYAHEAIKSRVRLHLTDAYKVMYDGGPVEVHSFVPYEAVFATTDPVAMDYTGWKIVDSVRAQKGLKSLKDAGREPHYILSAADLGLGIAEPSRIAIKEFTL